MRTLGIRRWMVVGMGLFLLLPALLYRITAAVVGERSTALAATAALLAMVVALLFVGVQIGRYVVRPLEAMSVAARHIARGELDIELPQSRVREVAEASMAFRAMRDGLSVSIERQLKLEEERRFFLGAIAHDLRTPLFALRGYLVGLEQGLVTSPEAVAEYVAVCRQKADQLDRLVADLFAYAKTDYLEQTLRREQLEFGLVVGRAVDGLRHRARDTGVEVVLVGPDVAYALAGDAHLLGRAVENLLDNALRHTPAGGSIEVRWHAAPDGVTFRVADTGTGIDPKDLPHLFEPLYRGDASRNPQTGGAGLGLTIAKRILEAHGGTLEAANGGTGGAEFTGRLPSTP